MVDISVGIALAPNDGTEVDQLLKCADMALYGAKSDGRGTYRYFEPEMDARMKMRRALEVDLRKALVNNEFELHYQPLVRLADNEISGCEALLRWRHPERGLISPAEFIPVAEETGLINAIGEWVLRQACAEAATWPDDIKVAVNVSPVQFRNRSCSQVVISALAASGLAPHRLELEITESVLCRATNDAAPTLHQLRELGVRISMDDFGTGYSSLSYLRSFPFDKIKIDRSFINDLSNGSDASPSCRPSSPRQQPHMTTTAEGVETEQQAKVLRAMGCSEMQGYLFSRPSPRGSSRACSGRARKRTSPRRTPSPHHPGARSGSPARRSRRPDPDMPSFATPPASRRQSSNSTRRSRRKRSPRPKPKTRKNGVMLPRLKGEKKSKSTELTNSPPNVLEAIRLLGLLR